MQVKVAPAPYKPWLSQEALTKIFTGMVMIAFLRFERGGNSWGYMSE